jgi:flagellar basal body-associated protein FliL
MDEKEFSMAEEIQQESSKKGGGLPLIVIIIAILLLQALVIIGVYWFFLKPPADPEADKKDKAKKEKVHSDSENPEEEEEEGPKKLGMVIPMKTIVINPQGSPSNYVAMDIGLEIVNAETPDVPPGKETVKKMEESNYEIAVKDVVQKLVSKYTVEDFQGPGLQDSLKVKFKKEFKQFVPEGIKLKQVHLSYIIQ